MSRPWDRDLLPAAQREELLPTTPRAEPYQSGEKPEGTLER